MINMNLEEGIKNYEGPPVYFIVTGGGVGIYELLRTPGASKVVYSIYSPYTRDEQFNFIRAYSKPPRGKDFSWDSVSSVSDQWVFALCRAATNKLKAEVETMVHNVRVIVCSAALTTNRERKGKNHAYIQTNEDIHNDDEDDYKLYYFELPPTKSEHSSKHERQMQDNRIAKKLLELTFYKYYCVD